MGPKKVENPKKQRDILKGCPGWQVVKSKTGTGLLKNKQN